MQLPSKPRYPIKSWPVVYAIVIGALLLDIVLLYLLTKAYA